MKMNRALWVALSVAVPGASPAALAQDYPNRAVHIVVPSVTQAKRFEGAREIPAIDEGLPGFDMPVAWYGFFGPPNLARPIVEKLAAAIGKSLEAPELRERVTETAMSVVFTGPAELPAFIRDTASAYGKIVKAAGVRLD